VVYLVGLSEIKPRIKWINYRGVAIRIEKHGKYSLVDMPSLVLMIRPRDEKDQILSIAAKLRLAKLYIDEIKDQSSSPSK